MATVSTFTVAPHQSWNSHPNQKDALELAKEATKGKQKMVWIYEVLGDACRPIAAYCQGKAYTLPGEPWRSCEAQFKGKFPLGSSWTRGGGPRE